MIYKILLLTLFVINSYAQIDLSDIKTFKADFIQSVFNQSNKELKYKGSLYISSQKRVLWQYKTPIKKNVYLIDNSVIIDEPELEQAIYTSLENGIDFVTLLKSAKKINENQFQSTINGIDYNINIKNDQIDSITYKDSFENNIIIKLKNVEKNIPLDESLFSFLPPDYYDIIRK
ncbi:MAG: LolA-like outer membrane lipoprotein chaperone [Halarcobacter sp.]